jgi:hypothetical protein
MIAFNRNIFFSFFASSLVLLSGCAKKDSITSDDLYTQLTGSTWAIHNYYNGGDKTSDFSGYVFSFASNGSCSIKKGSNTNIGSWQVVKGENNSGKLQLSISANPVLEQLNEWWNLEAISFNLVEFIVDDPTKSKKFHFIRL